MRNESGVIEISLNVFWRIDVNREWWLAQNEEDDIFFTAKRRERGAFAEKLIFLTT